MHHEVAIVAAQYYSFSLQVWRFVGGNPQLSEFLEKLVVGPDDGIRKIKKPNHRVDLVMIEEAEFKDAEEPSEAFVQELETRLIRVAKWLNKQPPLLFRSLRKCGFNTEILVTGWIDCDQMDLYLPPTFLKACGRLGLKLSIITNA